MNAVLLFRNRNAIDKFCDLVPIGRGLEASEQINLKITGAPDSLSPTDTLTLGIFEKGEEGYLNGRRHWDASNQTCTMICLVSAKQFNALKPRATPIPDKKIEGKTLDWELPEQKWE